MATRRPRIKAVAVPQRRENADKAVNKAREQTKEVVENVIKSPTDGRAADKHFGNTPARAVPSPRKASPTKSPLTPDVENMQSGCKVATSNPLSVPLLPCTRSEVSVSPKGEVPTSNPLSVPLLPCTRSEVSVSPKGEVPTSNPLSVPLLPCTRPEEFVSLQKKEPTSNTLLVPVQPCTQSGGFVSPKARASPFVKRPPVDWTAHLKIPPSKPKPKKNVASLSRGVQLKKVVDGNNTPKKDVMDGIVPLKSIGNDPKPIDSPKDVEDKSRPAFLGGSSTSGPSQQQHVSSTQVKSYSNRGVNLAKNDSMCSSQMAPQTPASGSSIKEKYISNDLHFDASGRMVAVRRTNEPIQRDKRTMLDVISANPPDNPAVPAKDELKAQEAKKRKLESRKKEESHKESNESTTGSAAPVPQTKLGHDRKLIIIKKSSVIKQPKFKLAESDDEANELWTKLRKRNFSGMGPLIKWNDAENRRFYRALAVLKTDFSIMAALFPGQTWRDLKMKFRKEEHLAQVEKALRSNIESDADRLGRQFTKERHQEKVDQQVLKEKLQRERIAAMKHVKKRQSQASKSLDMSALPHHAADLGCASADDLRAEAAMLREYNKKLLAASKRMISPKVATSTPKVATSTPEVATSTPKVATLTPVSAVETKPKPVKCAIMQMWRNAATVQRTGQPIAPTPQSPVTPNPLSALPTNLVPGSLVITVENSGDPSNKTIRTFIKQANGTLSALILEASIMESVVNFMKNKERGPLVTLAPCRVYSSDNMPKRPGPYTKRDL